MFNLSNVCIDNINLKDNTIVLLFSGGLDSTTALHILLTDEKYKDYNIHIHHIVLINNCNRHREELKATYKIINYYDSERLSYSMSRIELPSIDNNKIMDRYIAKFIGGYFLLNSKVEKVSYGVNKTDIERSTEIILSDIGNKIQQAFSDKGSINVLLNMTKQDCYNILPIAVRNMSFSCRTPLRQGEVCGKCVPCKDLEEIKVNEINKK